MQRGVLTLTREQLHDLAVRMNIKEQKGTNLYNKMLSAWLSNAKTVNIEVSADEVDQMYDVIALPKANDSLGIQGARQALNRLLESFREEKQS